jgi:hypothetical protein
VTRSPITTSSRVHRPFQIGWPPLIGWHLVAALAFVSACAGPATVTTSTVTVPATTAATATTGAVTTVTTAGVAPEIVLRIPVDGFISVEPVILVAGEVIGATDLTLNGEPAELANGFFEEIIPVVAGENLIEIRAVTPVGNSTTLLLTVHFLPEATEEFAYFDRVAADMVVADYAQFLTGQAAIDAAVEDGVTTPEEGVPNDYYIRNVNSQLRTLPVAPNALVMLVSPAPGAVGEVAVSMTDWLALFHEDGRPYDPEVEELPSGEAPHFGYFGAGWGAPYWLTLQDGTVRQIRQQYLP